jgi:ADP-ribosylglycohydrolase
VGSYYEGRSNIEKINVEVIHGITDDTQLTMATCESIIESGQVSAAGIAHHMLAWYGKGKLTGLGASTLKALRDLQVGAHWALSGRSGEYAAGNGAAMRIAPLAFFVNPETDRTIIRDVCNITHKNDEAYVGCLAILYSLHYIITNKWLPGISLIELITPQLPDCSVRDNLLKLQADPSLSIRGAGQLVGTSGHVIESVPFSIFSAGKIRESCFEDVLAEIILCGGDTDTNASIAGQIMGAFIGLSNFSRKVSGIFTNIKECTSILETAHKLSGKLSGQ